MGENPFKDFLPEGDLGIREFSDGADARIQAARPRCPCRNRGLTFHNQDILRQCMEPGRSGVYSRPLRRGRIAAGQTLICSHRERTRVPVRELFYHQRGVSLFAERLRERLANTSLTPAWRAGLESRLECAADD